MNRKPGWNIPRACYGPRTPTKQFHASLPPRWKPPPQPKMKPQPLPSERKDRNAT
jgi:hypothetical protein